MLWPRLAVQRARHRRAFWHICRDRPTPALSTHELKDSCALRPPAKGWAGSRHRHGNKATRYCSYQHRPNWCVLTRVNTEPSVGTTHAASVEEHEAQRVSNVSFQVRTAPPPRPARPQHAMAHMLKAEGGQASRQRLTRAAESSVYSAAFITSHRPIAIVRHCARKEAPGGPGKEASGPQGRPARSTPPRRASPGPPPLGHARGPKAASSGTGGACRKAAAADTGRAGIRQPCMAKASSAWHDAPVFRVPALQRTCAHHGVTMHPKGGGIREGLVGHTL